MNRLTVPAARLSAIQAPTKRSRGIRIGLLAIAGAVVLGDEARGQVGVESDREVLETFHHATGGPDWFFNTNWLSDEPLSEWHGVRTNDEGRVRWLVLQSNNLNGPIPPDLARLTHLGNLSLFRNELNGPIPPELGRLTSLFNLQLAWNGLSGPIPPELGQLTNLVNLLLSDNPLTGPIPPELGRLTNLQALQLGRNQLTGPIPPELGQLTDLEFLMLFRNELSGPIPPELGRLTRLMTFEIRGNQLTGPIPVELGNLTGLTRLTIDSDTGLCVPPEMQESVFGRLAVVENAVPLCDAVTALPGVAWWVLVLALAALGLRRSGLQRQTATP